jgi:hypothetical protein
MPVSPKSKVSAAARQAAFKNRMRDQGFEQVNLWVPAGAIPDLNELATTLRKSPDFTVGPVRNVRTGKLVSIKSVS